MRHALAVPIALALLLTVGANSASARPERGLVDVVTLGDHVYKKSDILPTLQTSERIVRAANLAQSAVGRTFTVVTTNGGVSVAVFALMGRIFMNQLPADDPFAAADTLPDHGPFQLILPSTICGPGTSMTMFGPGDPGYTGGRWVRPDGTHFLCPLVGGGSPPPQ